MKGSILLYYKALFVLLVSTLLYSCTEVDAYLGGKKYTLNQMDTAFYIPTETTINELKQLLVESEIIDDTSAFQSLLNYKKFEESMIGAGKYIISPRTRYNDLVNGFTKNSLGNGNKEVEVEVVFNNCRRIYDVAGKVSQQIEMDSAQFIDYLYSDAVLQKYGFSKERISVMFLPNTYRFYWDTNEEEFVERMAKEFKKFWNLDRMEKLSQIGFKNQSDAVVLASIVYEEQDKYPEEWRTIAGLYLNRIRKGMKLESDPTFRFCWGNELDGVERLTYAHRDRDCPYNTYKYAGLPPGPIYIPPSNVVDAVLNAEKNDYIFMCARPEVSGLHNFAKTLSQHNRNARLFQDWISGLQRKSRAKDTLDTL